MVVEWIERPTRVCAIRVRFHLVRKRKINEKEAGGWPILKKVIWLYTNFKTGGSHAEKFVGSRTQTLPVVQSQLEKK